MSGTLSENLEIFFARGQKSWLLSEGEIAVMTAVQHELPKTKKVMRTSAAISVCLNTLFENMG